MKAALTFRVASRGTRERGLLLQEILAAELESMADDVYEEDCEAVFHISTVGRHARYSKFSVFDDIRLRLPGAGGGAIVLTLHSRTDPLVFAGMTAFLLAICTVSQMTGGNFPWFIAAAPMLLGLWTIGSSYISVRAWWRAVGG